MAATTEERTVTVWKFNKVVPIRRIALEVKDLGTNIVKLLFGESSYGSVEEPAYEENIFSRFSYLASRRPIPPHPLHPMNKAEANLCFIAFTSIMYILLRPGSSPFSQKLKSLHEDYMFYNRRTYHREGFCKVKINENEVALLSFDAYVINVISSIAKEGSPWDIPKEAHRSIQYRKGYIAIQEKLIDAAKSANGRLSSIKDFKDLCKYSETYRVITDIVDDFACSMLFMIDSVSFEGYLCEGKGFCRCESLIGPHPVFSVGIDPGNDEYVHRVFARCPTCSEHRVVSFFHKTSRYMKADKKRRGDGLVDGRKRKRKKNLGSPSNDL